MRRLDDNPIDPEIAAELDAIDATLAGEPVDPRHADVAELALLLAADRPKLDAAFATRLDERVERRFAPSGTPPRRVRRWLIPAGAFAAAAAAAIVGVVVLSGGGSPRLVSAPAPTSAQAPARAQEVRPARAPGTAFAQSAAAPSASRPLQPPPNGRKIVQSAQLALTTAPDRVEDVAQEGFDVVGQQKGIVKSSTVTATGGSSGYAQFQLGVPSGALPQTMAALSALRYAHVASRTDSTQDVNDQYVADVRRLADDRALRTSLLKQLANATTQAQIDSLKAQIHDAESSISSDQATLRSLGGQINSSQITLTINAGQIPVAPGGGGFTIGKAAHDAGRVLTVAAGVALIALAALVPIGLLGALGWWAAASIRRRRRERALDTF